MSHRRRRDHDPVHTRRQHVRRFRHDRGAEPRPDPPGEVRDRVGDDFTAVASRIVEPVEAFFEDVFVMVEDEPLRAARLGLLAAVRDLGEGVLDWHELRL